MGRMRAFHARGCCRTCGQTNLRGVDGQGSPHGPLSNGAVFVGGWHARGSYMPARADMLAGGCWAGLSAMENAAARPQVRSYVPLSPPQGSQLCPVCLSIIPICVSQCHAHCSLAVVCTWRVCWSQVRAVARKGGLLCPSSGPAGWAWGWFLGTNVW